MFRVRAPISGTATAVLGVIPFLLIIVVYAQLSAARHRENPKDKLMPNGTQLREGWADVTKLRTGKFIEYTVLDGDTLASVATKVAGNASFAEDIKPKGGASLDDPPRELVAGELLRVPTTERRIIVDTMTSLRRLAVGMGIGLVLALALGLAMGLFDAVNAFLNPLVSGLAKIPPLALLPIIFIAMGTGESAKIAIIALGIGPTLVLDVLMRVREVPSELVTKAYTLGASTPEVGFKVVLAMVWPQFLNSVRLALGPAWVYLIASEAIASEAGLGYRIFVVQRQLGMNVILLYVALIMVLGLALDAGIRAFVSWRYPWAEIR